MHHKGIQILEVSSSTPKILTTLCPYTFIDPRPEFNLAKYLDSVWEHCLSKIPDINNASFGVRWEDSEEILINTTSEEELAYCLVNEVNIFFKQMTELNY